MALDTNQYGYLIDPLVPITDENGTTIKDGFLRVYIAGSSTPVITYRNFDGAVNEKTIELDNSGRCKYPVIVNKSLAYKVVVYDAQHSQETPIITVDKMFAIGTSVTAGTGATVVTGLNGFRTKPDGFVDASVIGTDGYVALDHTLVEDELDTDAKVTAVENDRYIPLLNEDVNDPDSKITLKRLKLWANMSTQVVLTPADFLGTGLSNDEWSAAVAAISGGKTAVVKWTESGASRVAFSSRYEADVGLVFVSEYGGFVTEYVVAATSGAHAVTTNVYEMAGSHSISRFDVMWDIDGNDYVFPAAQDVINSVGEYIEVQLVFHSPSGVNYVYALTYKSALHYEWTREDCLEKFNLDGAGTPVTWTWTTGDSKLKKDVATLDTDIGKIGGSIAPAYDPTDTYAEGDLVMYARRLYECTTDISTPEAWNSSHWQRTSVSDELVSDCYTKSQTDALLAGKQKTINIVSGAPIILDANGNLDLKISDGSFLDGLPGEEDVFVFGGRVYPTTKIGNLIWTTENLDYGDTGVYYNNDPTTYGVNGNKYGKLYTQNEALLIAQSVSGGWRLPRRSDFQALLSYYGTSQNACNSLRSASGWTTGSQGLNTDGFNAFPTGINYQGFSGLGTRTQFWGEEPNHPFGIFYDGVEFRSDTQLMGCSIRLVKDA